MTTISLVLLSSSVAICSAFIGHQQITPRQLPHTISILELFVLNSIASKLGFPELQVHSLVHSNRTNFAGTLLAMIIYFHEYVIMDAKE